jgi:tetratricopeptide (TPR) repeat protein
MTLPSKIVAPHAADRRSSFEAIGLTLILLATFVAYWPAMKGGVVWDDNFNLTRPDLQSVDGLYRIWFDPASTARYAQYYPLVHTAFWIEHKLWGDAVLGYHLMNVLWHSLAVVLFYRILIRLKIPGALLAAAIFALHPVMVESVAWMTEQKNVLSAVFYLGAILAYLTFDESRLRSRYFVSLGLFALALLTKTSTVTLPVALLVILWWQRGTLSWRRDVVPLIPFFLLGVANGLMTIWVERVLIGAKGGAFQTLVQHFLLAGRIIWFYLATLLWPANLIFVYPRWTIDPSEWWQWIFPIAVLGTTFVLWAIRSRWRAPLAAWLYYCGSLFPVLGFLNVYFFTYSYVADHFQYLASLGIITLAAAGITNLIAGMALPARRVGVALCVALVATLGVLTFRQSPMFADITTLYTTTIERNPNCSMAHTNLGKMLADSGDVEGAIAHYQSAIRATAGYADAHNNMANALVRTGNTSLALDEFRRAISLDSSQAIYHINMSSILTQLGRFEEAVAQGREGLKLAPDNFEAHHNLGSALLHAGHSSEAIDELRAAIAISPDDPLPWNTLGAAYMQIGQNQEASAQFERALQLRPNYPEAHNNFGQLLARTGQLPQAVEQFRQAIATNDNFAAAHISLGLVLSAQGNEQEAIANFEKAIKLGANQPDVHNSLGDSYRKSGKTGQAIEHYEAAVRLKPDFMPACANLAQTLALVNRSQEAIAVSEKAIEIARSSGQQEALEQFEDWLKHYRTELRRAEGGAPSDSSPRPNEATKPK